MRPGSARAISVQRPAAAYAWRATMAASSCAVKGPRSVSGSRTSTQRERHCFAERPAGGPPSAAACAATWTQAAPRGPPGSLPGATARTAASSAASSSGSGAVRLPRPRPSAGASAGGAARGRRRRARRRRRRRVAPQPGALRRAVLELLPVLAPEAIQRFRQSTPGRSRGAVRRGGQERDEVVAAAPRVCEHVGRERPQERLRVAVARRPHRLALGGRGGIGAAPARGVRDRNAPGHRCTVKPDPSRMTS